MRLCNAVNQPAAGAFLSNQVSAAGVANSTRYLPKFDGVGMFALFASAIVGNGQGELIFKLQLSDVGDAPFYLVDGVDESNRPYVYKPGGNTSISSLGGLDVSVDTGDNSISYGVVAEYKITGNFNDLEIGRLLARFSDAEFAKCQPIFFSFKDGIGTPQQRQVEFDFLLDKPQGYILPVGEKPSRNLVEATEEGVIATGSQFVNLAPLSTALSTAWFEVEPGDVLLVTRENSTRSRWQYSTNNLVSAEYGGDDTGDVIVVPDGATHLRIYFGNPSDINPSIEVRMVSNALILKGLPANIADVFDAVVQRGDGHYINKKTKAIVAQLSGYLLKQHQIQQIKGAIDAYWAKNKSFHQVDPDGVDDHVELSQPIAVVNNSVLSGEFVYRDGEVQEFVAGDDSNTDGVYVDKTSGFIRAFYYKSGSVGPILGSGSYVFKDGKVYRWAVTISDTGLATLSINDSVTDTESWDLDGNQLIRYLHKRDDQYSVGFQRSFLFIDRNNPLPIGAGGNSGFWPLDGSAAIAEQKLGQDKKGAIIARDGAAEEVVYSQVAEFTDSDAQYKVKAVQNDTLQNGGLFWVEIDAASLTGGGAKFVMSGNPDATGLWSPFINPGEVKSFLWHAVQDSYVGIQKASAGSVGTVKAKVTKLNGHALWSGLSADLSEIQPVTRNADGALVGPSIWDKDDILTDGATAAFGIIQGGAIYTPEVGRYHQVIAKVEGLLSGSISMQVGSQVTSIQSDDEYDLSGVVDAALVRVLAGSTPPNPGVTISISVRELIQLSAELQRQHDLEIVQKAIDKHLLKAEKSQNLADLDGVDDYILIPPMWLEGSFEIVRSFCVSDTTTEQWLYSDWNDLVSKRSVAIRINNGSIETYISHNGVNTITGPVSPITANVHHTLKFKFNSGSSMELSIDGGEPVVVETSAGLVFDTGSEINLGRKASGIKPLDGKDGFLSILDIAKPQNSRFYVHDKATGKMVDVLHPDGSMDGSYIGMSPELVEIKTFKKKGDDWLGGGIWNGVSLLPKAVNTVIANTAVGVDYSVIPSGLSADSDLRIYTANGLIPFPAEGGLIASEDNSTMTVIDYGEAQTNVSFAIKEVIKGA